MRQFSYIARITCVIWLVSSGNLSYAESEDLSTLKAVVVTAHTRSIHDISRLQTSIAAAPTATVQVPKGGTPSSVIAKVYGIGISDSRPAYSAIEKRIFELNDISDDKTVPTGPLIVPDLPTLTTKKPIPDAMLDRAVKNRAVQKVDSLNDLTETPGSVQKSNYKDTIKIAGSITDSLNYVRADTFGIEDAASFVTQAEMAGITLAQGYEVGIELANVTDDCPQSDFDFITPEDALAISKGLRAASAARERYLIILDSGWPTPDSKRESLSILRKIFDRVRSAIRLNSSDIYAFPITTIDGAFAPPEHPHSCLIDRALKPMSRLDNEKRIKTIFVPLRPGQLGAKEYFHEVLALSQLISLKGSSETFGSTPTKAQIALAKAFAESSLKDIPALTDPWRREDNVIRVYEPLISGLLRILGVYALIDLPNQPTVDVKYWISTSWNFTKYASPPDLPASDAYMVFAATGNDGLDFVKKRRLFASEALMNRRVVAVMNSDHEDGRSTCTSATFSGLWETDYSQNAVVSFPGRISSQKDVKCPGIGGGTSFSAPRLAWLSAASELINPISTTWQLEISKRLVLSRAKIIEDVNAAPINITKFISQK